MRIINSNLNHDDCNPENNEENTVLLWRNYF